MLRSKFSRFGLGLAICLLAVPALAGERVARQGSDEVRIFEEPCVHAGTLIHIDRLVPGGRDAFQKAEVRFGGQRFFACWRTVGSSVHLIYEDGDQGVIPQSQLKEVPSA